MLLEAGETLEHGLSARHRAAAAEAARGADPLRGAALLPSETAQLLGTTVAAVNSARQRARATLDERPDGSGARPSARLRSTERALLDRYVDALRRHDVAAIVALARADAGSTLSRRPDGARPGETRD